MDVPPRGVYNPQKGYTELENLNKNPFEIVELFADALTFKITEENDVDGYLDIFNSYFGKRKRDYTK